MSVMVTQADRDAAAAWARSCYPSKHAAGFADDIAAGKADDGALTQAFASHREASSGWAPWFTDGAKVEIRLANGRGGIVDTPSEFVRLIEGGAVIVAIRPPPTSSEGAER